MSDLLNVQNGIKVKNIDQPVEGGQNNQVSFRKNDYERTPYADEVNLSGNNNNTGKFVGLGVAALAIGSAIYAGLHGKNILTKAEKETGLWKNIKTGYENFFKGSEKAAERIKTSGTNNLETQAEGAAESAGETVTENTATKLEETAGENTATKLEETAGENTAVKTEEAVGENTAAKAEETIAKKAKTWDEVIKDPRFDDDAVKMLNEELSEVEKSKVISRDLLSFKTGDDRLLGTYGIKWLAKLSDEQFANIEGRELLKLKNADGIAFSGTSVSCLAELDETAFAKIKERELLKLKNADGRALYGSEISILARAEEDQLATIKKELNVIDIN